MLSKGMSRARINGMSSVCSAAGNRETMSSVCEIRGDKFAGVNMTSRCVMFMLSSEIHFCSVSWWLSRASRRSKKRSRFEFAAVVASLAVRFTRLLKFETSAFVNVTSRNVGGIVVDDDFSNRWFRYMFGSKMFASDVRITLLLLFVLSPKGICFIRKC